MVGRGKSTFWITRIPFKLDMGGGGGILEKITTKKIFRLLFSVKNLPPDPPPPPDQFKRYSGYIKKKVPLQKTKKKFPYRKPLPQPNKYFSVFFFASEKETQGQASFVVPGKLSKICELFCGKKNKNGKLFVLENFLFGWDIQYLFWFLEVNYIAEKILKNKFITQTFHYTEHRLKHPFLNKMLKYLNFHVAIVDHQVNLNIPKWLYLKTKFTRNFTNEKYILMIHKNDIKL